LALPAARKKDFLTNVRVRELLERRFGLVLDARRAGSVEMVRERALLDQYPQFLWPSSSVLVEVARTSGLNLSRDQVIFTSPIVLYSWDRIADGLVKGGFAQPAGGPHYTIDLEKLLKAIIAGESWSALGVPDLFGRAGVVSTDPSKSNSGFMFARLAANLLSGDVVTLETLGRVDGDVGIIFKRMGFKPSSSGKLFDDYIAGGAAAQPLVVGYENQLVEWVMQDPGRWKRLEAAAPGKAGNALPTADSLFGAPRGQPDTRGRRAYRRADERGDARTGLGRSRLPRAPRHNRQDPKPAAAHANARFDRRCPADARGGRNDGVDRPLRGLIYRPLICLF